MWILVWTQGERGVDCDVDVGLWSQAPVDRQVTGERRGRRAVKGSLGNGEEVWEGLKWDLMKKDNGSCLFPLFSWEGGGTSADGAP